MSTIFMADAAGVLGAALIESLGDEFKLVAGVPEDAGFNDERVEIRKFDFGRQDGWAEAMEGCDKLFLNLPVQEQLTRQGRLAVNAAREIGIGYVIRPSRYGASSDAHWRLGRELGMVDQFVEDSGMEFTILRPNTYMQVFSTRYRDMIRRGSLRLAEEDHPVSYMDVRDVADCAARLFRDHKGFENSFYALTGPAGLSPARVAEEFTAGGVEVACDPVEEETYVQWLKDSGEPRWNSDMLVSLSRVVKLGMMGNVTHAVEYLTGNAPRTFENFVAGHRDVWG